MKTVKAWCVKSPNGKLIPETVNSDLKASARCAFEILNLDYKQYRHLGFEEVPVEIREVKDEQES